MCILCKGDTNSNFGTLLLLPLTPRKPLQSTALVIRSNFRQVVGAARQGGTCLGFPMFLQNFAETHYVFLQNFAENRALKGLKKTLQKKLTFGFCKVSANLFSGLQNPANMDY